MKVLSWCRPHRPLPLWPNPHRVGRKWTSRRPVAELAGSWTVWRDQRPHLCRDQRPLPQLTSFVPARRVRTWGTLQDSLKREGSRSHLICKKLLCLPRSKVVMKQFSCQNNFGRFRLTVFVPFTPEKLASFVRPRRDWAQRIPTSLYLLCYVLLGLNSDIGWSCYLTRREAAACAVWVFPRCRQLVFAFGRTVREWPKGGGMWGHD